MNRRRRRRSRRSIPIFLFPATVVALGLAAVGLSFVLPGGSSEPSVAVRSALLEEGEPAPETFGSPLESKITRLIDEDAPAAARPSEEPSPPKDPPVKKPSPPVVRSAPPTEAGPAVQVRGISSAGRGALVPDSVARGSAGGGVSSTTTASNNTPFSVVVVPEGPAAVESAANAIVDKLKGRGLQAKVASLAEAGRPDAVIVLGEARTAASETWFCDPGPESSPRLAKNLMRIAGESGVGASAPGTNFPCEDIHSGRARVPAVLLELPPSVLERRDAFGATADGVANGITRYFTDNAAAVRTARGAARLSWPANGPITSYYGPSHPLGIDIGEWEGNITAATAGTVVFAGGDPCCSYGRYVVIQSAEGVETLYAHLSTLAVRKGQKVRQGQNLGAVGCTGRCSGPHLHFEVYDQGRRQNPLLYLP